MVWSLSVYSIIGGGAAVVSVVVATRVWRGETQRGARPFIWLLLALGGWSMAYAIQLGFTSPSGQLLWQRIGLAIGGTIPTLWLVFTICYVGQRQWLSHGKLAILATQPLLFAFLTLTNPFHELIWHGATLSSTQAGPVLDLSLATGYYLNIAYAYAIITLGLALVFHQLARTTRIYRKPAAFLVLGVIPPFVGNIAYTFRISLGPLPALDPTPFLFVLTGVFWAFALYRFDLLNRAPLARRRVIDEMGDGLIVLDADGNVVNVNVIGKRAFDPPPAVGRPITEFLPDVNALEGARDALDGRTIDTKVEGHQRAYDVAWTRLTDDQGTIIGHGITLRDITERNAYEQRLEVAQRILRHNLRNDMNIIQGWADHLSETTNGHTDIAQRISDTAGQLIDLSEKTHTMVQMDPEMSRERVSIDVAEHLPDLAEGFATKHPDVTVECTIADSTVVRLPGHEYLVIPVENLIENAIEHNDTEEPWVHLSAESTGERVRIVVEDNGPLIPEMERTVIERGMEDPLVHGSGLGLWLTNWSIKTAGGRLRFTGREPYGNSITIELPAAD